MGTIDPRAYTQAQLFHKAQKAAYEQKIAAHRAEEDRLREDFERRKREFYSQTGDLIEGEFEVIDDQKALGVDQ